MERTVRKSTRLSGNRSTRYRAKCCPLSVPIISHEGYTSVQFVIFHEGYTSAPSQQQIITALTSVNNQRTSFYAGEKHQLPSSWEQWERMLPREKAQRERRSPKNSPLKMQTGVLIVNLDEYQPKRFHYSSWPSRKRIDTPNTLMPQIRMLC